MTIVRRHFAGFQGVPGFPRKFCLWRRHGNWTPWLLRGAVPVRRIVGKSRKIGWSEPNWHCHGPGRRCRDASKARQL